MRARIITVLLVSLALLGACSQPAAMRPREGAPVIESAQATRNDGKSAVPPTLASAAPKAAPVPGSPQPSIPSPTVASTHVITATEVGAVNMRSGPSQSAPVVTTLKEGTLVEAVGDPVSAEGRAWQQVRSENREGWVIAVVVRRR